MYLIYKSDQKIQNVIRYSIFRNLYFTSCSTANYLTVIADRIARVLTTFGVTQAVVLESSYK